MSLESADNLDAEALLTSEPLVIVEQTQTYHWCRAAKIGALTLSAFLAIVALGTSRTASSALCPSGGVESVIGLTGSEPTRRLQTSPGLLDGVDNLPIYLNMHPRFERWVGGGWLTAGYPCFDALSAGPTVATAATCTTWLKQEKTWWTVVTKRGLSFDDRRELADRVFGANRVVIVAKAIPMFVVHCSFNDLQDVLKGKVDLFDWVEQEDNDEKEVCQIPLNPQNAAAGATAAQAGWNLGRSVQRVWPRTNTYEPMERGHHGEGVHVYVAGTGVRTTHAEFGGRAFPALEYLKSTAGWSDTNRGSTWNGECHGTNTNCATDGSGRGTAVASIIGGKTYGVAKRSILHAVKVVENAEPVIAVGSLLEARRCPAFGENIIDALPHADGFSSKFMYVSMTVALDWIIDQGERPSVVSVDFSYSGKGHRIVAGAAVETDAALVLTNEGANDRSGKLAYDTAIGYGIVIVVAAGNDRENDDTAANALDGHNACLATPASIPSVITVGSTTFEDEVSQSSNYGSCIDIWAPGSSVDVAFWRVDMGILSTQRRGDTGAASAHVAGAAALILRDHSHGGRRLGHHHDDSDHSLSPARVKQWLLESSTHGQLKKRGTSNANDDNNQNEILYVGGLWSKTSWGYNFHDSHGHHHHSDHHGGGHHYHKHGHDHHNHGRSRRGWNYGNHDHRLQQKIQQHANHLGAWYCQWAQ